MSPVARHCACTNLSLFGHRNREFSDSCLYSIFLILNNILANKLFIKVVCKDVNRRLISEGSGINARQVQEEEEKDEKIPVFMSV